MEKKTIWDLGRDSLEQFRAKAKNPVVMVLDNIRSLNNIGSIFRTADGFAIEGIMLCGITACPPSADIHKTALGAEDSVAWRYYPTTVECIDALRREGWKVAVLEQVEGSVPLPEYKPEPGEKLAVVAGHEVGGVDQRVVDMADVCIEIPQYGTKHSLNVAVSAALALYQLTQVVRPPIPVLSDC